MEKEPQRNRKHKLAGLQDKKIALPVNDTITREEYYRSRGTQIEGTPLQQTQFDLTIAKQERERIANIEAIRQMVRRHPKTPLPSPKE